MKEKRIRLEVSGIEVINNPFEDWAVRKYPISILVKFMMKANEIGLTGKKIEVIEVQENFGARSKYIDFIVTSQPQ